MREGVEGGGQQRKREEGRGKLEEQLRDVDSVWGTKESLGREHVRRRRQRDGLGEDGHFQGPFSSSSAQTPGLLGQKIWA